MIKNRLKEKAEALEFTLASEAQARYVSWVAEEEGIEWAEAWTRATDPSAGFPEIRLGFKMSDPLMQIAMNAQTGKKHREEATERFRERLDPEELEIFDRDVATMDTRTKFKAALKRERKGKTRFSFQGTLQPVHGRNGPGGTGNRAVARLSQDGPFLKGVFSARHHFFIFYNLIVQ